MQAGQLGHLEDQACKKRFKIEDKDVNYQNVNDNTRWLRYTI